MVRMRKSRLSQSKQNRLMEHFLAATTARCAAALVEVNSKTAVYYFHSLREIICYHLELDADSVVDGEIEVDESYFGSRRKGKRGRGAGRKVPVFSLLKRGDKVTRRSFPMPRQRHYSLSLSARWCLTASSIRTVGAVTTYWMSRNSSSIASIIQSYLLTNRTTSTASRTSETRRSVICTGSMVSPKSALGYS